MSNLNEDLLAKLNELPITEDYSKKERYADFRKVFMGTEEGKRVYRELLSWGRMFNSSVSIGPVDPYKVLFFEGHRDFAIQLMATVNIEPLEQPTKTNKLRSK